MKRNLQDVRLILKGFLFVGFILSVFINYTKKKKIDGLEKRIEVLSDHFQLLNHWMEIKNEGKTISSYLEKMGYRHIAIYGMAELSNRILEELSGSSIRIDYGIDQDVSCSITRISQVYSPEDDFPETDAIIVTPYSSYDTIQSVLDKKVTCPIISLEEVIWSV